MKIAVLASGGGSNLQALMDACASGFVSARIAVVFSNKADAGALDRAKKAGIPTAVKSHKELTPEDLDRAVVEALAPFKPDWICLAGYLRRVTSVLIGAYPNKILNIHPALLPAFGGKGLYGMKVHQAVLESGSQFTGATIHFVDERYDHGAILVQERVRVLEGDSPESLAHRVLEAEHRIYPQAVKLCVEGRVKLEGGKALIL